MRTTMVAMAVWLMACGGASADDLRTQAVAALDAGDAAKALDLAEQGLAAAAGDKAATWRLESVKLDALARQGKGKDVAAGLDRLAAGDFGAQVTAALHVALADKAASAGDGEGAVYILAAGDKRFPDDAGIDQALAKAQKGAGSGVTDALAALGYLAGDEEEEAPSEAPVATGAATDPGAAYPAGSD
jgi:predicted Zn-dependent protease